MTPIDSSTADRDIKARLQTVMAERDELEMLLRERERDRKEFFATLAHEMRNPLAAMRSAIHVLRLADTDQATASAARGMLERQLTQLVRLVDDLADVAHVAQEQLELDRDRVNLRALLQGAIETNRAMLESRQQHLQLDLPADPVWLYVDSRRLIQAFASIINNASKFSDPGTDIRIHAAREEQYLVVTVTDQGVGIAEHMLPQVFDMFARNGSSNRDSQIGLGVGMTLAKRLVELHNGNISVHSDGPGRGSSFMVKLNTLDVPPLRAVLPAEEIVASHSRRVQARVLIVDDNRDGAQGLALMLDMEGHEVRTAADGLEALTIAEEFHPHVVLLDIGMPGMDGYETARRLRTRPWAQSILLCALTGWGQEDDKRRARTAGFDRHLVKPIDPEQISRIVAEVCQTAAVQSDQR